MASYEKFAQIYDQALNQLPYTNWFEYIKKIFEKYSISPEIVLDLGCGTGTMTNLMAKNGYDMIGVDLSEDMLTQARIKAIDENLDIIYLGQDMRELDLYGTVDAVVAVGDSMNYILDEKDLLKVFKNVALFLDDDGLFVFDMNSVYKFEVILGNKTYAENCEDHAYIWENYYDTKTAINEYKVTIFIKEVKNLFDKSTEYHYERGYPLEKVIALIEEAGLILEGVHHETTFNKVTPTTERLFFITRRPSRKSVGNI